MLLSLRVGQAVDVVGYAGKPKKIKGFQTHSSPVLVNQGERAELATDEYIPIQDPSPGEVRDRATQPRLRRGREAAEEDEHVMSGDRAVKTQEGYGLFKIFLK